MPLPRILKPFVICVESCVHCPLGAISCYLVARYGGRRAILVPDEVLHDPSVWGDGNRRLGTRDGGLRGEGREPGGHLALLVPEWSAPWSDAGRVRVWGHSMYVSTAWLVLALRAALR